MRNGPKKGGRTSWDGANWALTSMTVPITQAGVGSIAYDTDAGALVAVVDVITGHRTFGRRRAISRRKGLIQSG